MVSHAVICSVSHCSAVCMWLLQPKHSSQSVLTKTSTSWVLPPHPLHTNRSNGLGLGFRPRNCLMPAGVNDTTGCEFTGWAPGWTWCSLPSLSSFSWSKPWATEGATSLSATESSGSSMILWLDQSVVIPITDLSRWPAMFLVFPNPLSCKNSNQCRSNLRWKGQSLSLYAKQDCQLVKLSNKHCRKLGRHSKCKQHTCDYQISRIESSQVMQMETWQTWQHRKMSNLNLNRFITCMSTISGCFHRTCICAPGGNMDPIATMKSENSSLHVVHATQLFCTVSLCTANTIQVQTAK